MTKPRQDQIGGALSALLTDSNNTSRAMMITQAARLIFSAYRKDDFADPETFVFQLGIILGRYPDDVIVQLSDPLIGIQRRRKRAPSLADIVEACDDLMDRREVPKPLAIEPPIDREMQRRVGELLTDLAAKLHVDAQAEREGLIAKLAERDEERREEAIRRAWRARCLEPPTTGPLVSPHLSDIVEGWRAGE